MGFVPLQANPSSAPLVSPGQWVGNQYLTGAHLVPRLGSGLSLTRRLGSKTGPLSTQGDETTRGKGVWQRTGLAVCGALLGALVFGMGNKV